jgi:signal transduction histidine kinase
MLHKILSYNRLALIERCKSRVARRLSPKPTEDELEFGIPLFIDQLIQTLRALQTREVRGVSGSAPEAGAAQAGIGVSAQRHGRELLKRGFTIEQVVRDYGDLCQEITGLALELDASIEVEEFRILNRCLDDAIAEAVTEFSYQRDSSMAGIGMQVANERIGFLAHELRNFINTAMLAVLALKSGQVGLSGATGAVLDRSLTGMRDLIDRSLVDVRAASVVQAPNSAISLAGFIAQVKQSAELDAKQHKCELTVAEVDPDLAIEVDRDTLFSAVSNLLQNAFKFTRHGTEVKLNAHAAADRVLISVEDHCGGLHQTDMDRMFLPFSQSGMDRTGLGLGLAISRRGVEANGGTLSVRDLPGAGCVFTIELPRSTLPDPVSP